MGKQSKYYDGENEIFKLKRTESYVKNIGLNPLSNSLYYSHVIENFYAGRIYLSKHGMRSDNKNYKNYFPFIMDYCIGLTYDHGHYCLRIPKKIINKLGISKTCPYSWSVGVNGKNTDLIYFFPVLLHDDINTLFCCQSEMFGDYGHFGYTSIENKSIYILKDKIAFHSEVEKYMFQVPYKFETMSGKDYKYIDPEIKEKPKLPIFVLFYDILGNFYFFRVSYVSQKYKASTRELPLIAPWQECPRNTRSSQ